MQYVHLIQPLIKIAQEAGNIILQHYEGEIKVKVKEDESPVTSADIAANDYIMKNLRQVAPEIRIVSEEKKNQQLTDKDVFFLVDPLDGTKSYIKRTGEFTVNIAIIANGAPVFGVVYIPVTNILYYTGEDGAYKLVDGQNKPVRITVRKPANDGLIVMASQSHLNEETKNYIDALNVKEFRSAGSSLKFCYVADGQADIYPRFGPTMEWDTAAAHAVLNAAGGTITQPDGRPFNYGKSGYLNGFFIAQGGKNNG